MLRPKTGAGLGILEVNNRRNEIRFGRESDDHHILIIYWNQEKSFYKTLKNTCIFCLFLVKVMRFFNLVKMSTTEKIINVPYNQAIN